MIHLVIVAGLVVVSTVLLGLFLVNAPFLPVQASQQAVTIDSLFQIHWWLIAFFVSLITIFVVYSVLVFHRRKGERGDGVYMEGNQRLEIIWTIIPIAIVLWLAVIGADSLSQVERRDPEAITVDVFAAQWSWRFQYTVETEDGTLVAVASDTLVLPNNQQILLRLHSQDVIHSFFVPEFRVKQDVLPGGEQFVRELRITPTLEGTYKVRCAEVCGRLHYDMQAEISVISGSEFRAWLIEQSADCNLSDAECGQRWAETFGCFACHSIDGSELVGPTWQGLFGSQVPLADGNTVTADGVYLHTAIADPNAQIVQGFVPGVMPQNFGEIMTEEQINQIIAFIMTLQ
ncbi:MAG: cytochrome c oxidase subunit II [Anaerolineales bacterium]